MGSTMFRENTLLDLFGSHSFLKAKPTPTLFHTCSSCLMPQLPYRQPKHSFNSSFDLHSKTGTYTYPFSLSYMTPMVAKPSSTSSKDNEPIDLHAYCNIVGKLTLFATITCLDITFVMNQLSQWMSERTLKDMESIHRLLRYLKGSPSLRFLLTSTSFGSDSDEAIIAFFNSNWVTFPTTHCLVINYCIYLGLSLIS